ncbi:MAG TPA: GNAT family N-acetyltransferase [Gaiellaceae bacterium]|nr:GNAT family N-acetyltransferase [Gaiellaceae bacterium]
MAPVEIRPFRRSDREQLTALVNAHVAAVVPGVAVSVNTLLSQLEREPEEAIVDPWVVERRTLVAIERDAVVAGAHLLRYDDSAPVSESYRGIGEIRWLVGRPETPAALDALIGASVELMDGWAVRLRYADGGVPAPFVYGIPENWPHIRGALLRAGFAHTGHVELILHAAITELPAFREPPVRGLELRRSVGRVGPARLAAVLEDEELGMIEVRGRTGGGRNPATVAWADVGNLNVRENYRRRGVGTWLVAAAGEWLRLGGFDRLVDYVWPEQEEAQAFLASVGFRHLTRTERGWQLP